MSRDGRTWTDVSDPRMGVLTAVVGGPHGFVAVGGDQDEEPEIWTSVDGIAWERVASDAFASRWPRGSDEDFVDVTVTSGAATDDGYVLVGDDRLCLAGRCPRNGIRFAEASRRVSGDAVIWTSDDGRSWSRVADDGRFDVTGTGTPAGSTTAEAGPVVAWGSRFIAGGMVGDHPVVWISDPEEAP
jgi:hypothetical protein